MAEQIISPGVFTRENDQSFLPQGVGAIGAAFIGPTAKGPAFVPTVITSYSQFVDRFGTYGINGIEDTYIPQTVNDYLNHAGSVTVCRVLGGGGYKLEAGVNEYVALGVFPSGSTEGLITSVLFPSKHSTAKIDLSGTLLTNQTPVSASVALQSNTGEFSIYNTGSSYIVSGSNLVAGQIHLKISGSPEGYFNYSGSTNPNNTNYIWNQIGYSADNSKNGSNSWGNAAAYTYLNFKSVQEKIFAGTLDGYMNGALDSAGYLQANGSSSAVFQLITQNSEDLTFNGDGLGKNEQYSYASTPWIISQIALGEKQLFRFHTLNHGKDVSRDYKISIANLQEPSDIDGAEQYSKFSVLVRKFSDTDSSPVILEQYNDCTLDPNDNNYIAKKIGDRYPEYNETLKKVEILGNYNNMSNLLRVEVDASVEAGSSSPKLSPKGFLAIKDPIKVGTLTVDTSGTKANSTEAASTHYFPSASYEGVQQVGTDGVYNTNGYLGFKFIEKEPDNDIFVRSLPLTPDSNVAGNFNVENYSVHANAGITFAGSLSASLTTTGTNGPTANELKFTIPFQGGDDGFAPWTVKQIGGNISSTNAFGMDLSSTSATGYKAYKKALDILSNQDEYDINLLALPGVLKSQHSAVTNAAINMVEGRGDAFYVMDLGDLEDTINETVDAAGGLDTNYASVYYPWVRVLDVSSAKPMYVPPSVIVPGAIAQSDNIGAEWFAPAGLNRGILGTVIETKNNLTQAERDVLYNNKINPIANFPATGVCIWGQKTLQERSTALDRINVRRLLITLKKFIASSSKYLVFEQNTLQTRTRFLNIVTPYLENVQQQQGLYAFRVVMDDTNNTSVVIDRNELVGAIYLQPTKTAEFIILDFNVMPTGATFPS